MNNQCKLSNVTLNYLNEFDCILEEMISKMTSAELNDSISHNFIVQMIPHHMAAIEMSENILKYTTNIRLQNIAQNIVREQTKSIENMRKVENVCSNVKNSEKDLCKYQDRMNMIMENMFSKMKTACRVNRINCNFMYEMIPHHEGAVEMSENTLKFNICRQLKPILSAIITSQEKGIMQMQNLLQCIGCL